MPQDKYLPPVNLKVDQLVAASYGHVRYESGVTKWYPPVTQVIASWSTTDIFSDPRDFYRVVTGIYTEGLSPVAGSVATVGGNSFVAGNQPARVQVTVDLNRYASVGDFDNFVATAGHHMMLGFVVRRRSPAYSDPDSLETSIYRSQASAVSALVLINSGLTALNSGVTATAVSSSSALPTQAGYFAGEPTAITFSAAQNAANALVVTVPFRSAAASSNAPAYVLPWTPATSPDNGLDNSTQIYRLSVLSGGATVASAFITVGNIATAGTGGFVGTIAAASIPTTGAYTVRLEEKRPATYSTVPSGYALDTYAVVCQGVSTVSASTVMTLTGLDTSAGAGGGAVTGGGSASVSTVTLNTAVSSLQSDWTVQDLQVNLRSRAVTSSLSTVRLKPGDSTVLGILFHTGTFVVDPGATAVRLAARGAGNGTPYYLYNTNTTIVSVSSTNYYRMEVLANDEDLLAGQAASLLAGSNAAQSLVGEIQWVTTLGTFSSDSFTINAPNEVVREPDV